MLKFDLTYEQLYKMDMNELIRTLENRRKGLAYRVWKEANLIAVGVSDLFSKKNAKSNFPENPEKASPELYPPKKTMKKPKCLYNTKVKLKGGLMVYE